MENLLEFKARLQMGSATIICDICSTTNEGQARHIPAATMRCLECQKNYCDSCDRVHQIQKRNNNHQIAKFGSDTQSVMFCNKHKNKPLDYYCAECKKIVCVSCFVESHKLHDCKDVNTVDTEFREIIEKKAWKISAYADEIQLMRKNMDKRKRNFLKKIIEKVTIIHRKKQDLKDMIDRHTKSLLDELSKIKLTHLEEMEKQIEQIDEFLVILRSFEVYCTELRTKASVADICSSGDELIRRADDLEIDHGLFIDRHRQSIEVSFQATDFQNPRDNVVGKFEVKTENTAYFENIAVVVGSSDGNTNITNDVTEINLHRPEAISAQENIPTKMVNESVATVYCNMMYVTGIGVGCDEIWKYKESSGWKKCALLRQGRRKHSAAFINEVLYICGGFMDSNKSVLDSVEAYNAVTDKCTIVGTLVYGVHNSGNCVPFKGSLYIFGGSDRDNKVFGHVQVYNTKENTCSVLSRPMPRTYTFPMRAIVGKTSVILLGRYTCFLFNFETETWQERNQFKTDVDYFGLALENEKVFVFGGGISVNDKDGKTIWKCRDDVRYFPLQNIIDDKPIEWKIHGKLPKPSFIDACAKMRFPVNL